MVQKKLTEAEREALWRLLENVKADAELAGARKQQRQPWRR
tara:strand:+ start:437 stop:559 length:123 start_codon:yes stop_codon:yes gene_type:complete